ncbi:MAG: DUF5690 family protein [Bacteroidota bacterium]
MKTDKKDIQVLLWGSLAPFGVYFCMYAFRKPFTVATYEDFYLWGVNYKIVLLIAQVLGYMLAKFIGIAVISSLWPKNRFRYLIMMVLMAELSLLMFGWIPHPFNSPAMFLNGLSLGMMWGVVFSYLEGRRFTEVLGVILCSSFIVSSGAVKSVGFWIMDHWGISEFWMPAVAGALFLLPFLAFSLLLEKIPPPTLRDKTLRKERSPMNGDDRKKTILRFLFPLLVLVFFYVCLTVIRDFRDNFSREIWDSIGFEGNASIYTLSEIPVAILVLLIIGLFVLIKDNYRAFLSYHYLLLSGSLLLGLSTFLFQTNAIGPVSWMIGVGLALYACYVPFNCLLFDRMIATFRINGNAGFLIYFADAFGYLGSMGVLLYKNFGRPELSWLRFFTQGTYLLAVLGSMATIISLILFRRKYKRRAYVLEHQKEAVNL